MLMGPARAGCGTLTLNWYLPFEVLGSPSDCVSGCSVVRGLQLQAMVPPAARSLGTRLDCAAG